MFFKRLHEKRIAVMAMLLTAIIFGFFGYLLATKQLTFELAKDGAFFIWACVMLLTLLLEKGGGRPSTHRPFASTVGGHVAGLIGNLKQLVGGGAGGEPRLMLARSEA